jgi:flagellin
MSLTISTNTAALRAGTQLGINQKHLQKSFDRLASGSKLSSPVDDPGGLAVSMKLSAAVNRISGAQNNVQNAISFMEVQDGMLDTVGQIIDRMSELKGLSSQDPMKSDQDRASYNNEFKDLQAQLYDISKMKFNGVSLFAEHTKEDGADATDQAVFGGAGQLSDKDNTLTIFTSAEGAAGSKVSVHKSVLLSALTFNTAVGSDGTRDSVAYKTFDGGGTQEARNNGDGDETTDFTATFATQSGGDFLDLGDISVGVISQALENVAFLRAQNGGVHSRLAFNAQSLTQQKTNMRAALGRMVDVDIAEETTKLAKYSVLSQASASMLAQANQNTDIALMLLR